MPCACNKNRAASGGTVQRAGTFRVMVNGRQVYESTNGEAAKSVAIRFDNATILEPGQSA